MFFSGLVTIASKTLNPEVTAGNPMDYVCECLGG